MSATFFMDESYLRSVKWKGKMCSPVKGTGRPVDKHVQLLAVHGAHLRGANNVEAAKWN